MQSKKSNLSHKLRLGLVGLMVAVSISVVSMSSAVPAAAATCAGGGGSNAVQQGPQWYRTYALLAGTAASNCQIATAIQVGSASGTHWWNSNRWVNKGSLSDKTWHIGGYSYRNYGWYTRQI